MHTTTSRSTRSIPLVTSRMATPPPSPKLDLLGVATTRAGPEKVTRIGPIVVACESDYLSPGALRFAELLARRERVNAHAVATVPPVDPPRSALGRDDAEALRAGRLSRRRHQLRRLLHRTVGRGAFFSTGVAVGDSERAFEAAARERGAEYILMGLDDPGAPGRTISERTALQVARLADVPVLAVPRSGATLPSRALAAVDGSAGSLRVARAAARLLDPGARLTLVHVVPLRDGQRRDEGPAHRRRGRYTTRQLDRLAAELRAAADIRVETAWLEGEPIDAVLTLAARDGVDLIACGMNAGPPPHWHLVTSTAAALLAGTRQAVLLVPTAAAAA